MTLQKKPHVAIIGAGWAGLSAAIRLHEAGLQVTVFESAHTLGGRARRVLSPSLRSSIDNGQHLLLGAYTETLALLHRLGLPPEQQFQRCRLTLQSADGRFRLKAAPLPAPAHLAWAILAARGLPWRDKWRMASLHWRLRQQRWQTPVDMTVLQWLRENRQSETLIGKVWHPLCIAALNTPVDQACAQLFAHVLRDSTGAQAWASDLLIPRTDLSDLWPDHIPAGIARHTGQTIRQLEAQEDGVLVDGRPFDAAVVAANAPAAARLLSSLQAPKSATGTSDAAAGYLAQLQAFEFLPIATLTLQLDAPWRLPFPMLMLSEDASRGHYGQWLFERSRFIPGGDDNTMLSIVISNAGLLAGQDKDELVRAMTEQVREQTRDTGPMPAVQSADLIVEKRATFAATPGLLRPGNSTPWPRIWCAGDWTDTGYPGVLEGAVISGRRAAEDIVSSQR